jgi:hypothetical protein
MHRGRFLGIELDLAFATLLGSAEDCLGHREILWSGICAWMKRSGNQASAKKAIAKQAARFIALAESHAREKILTLARLRREGHGPSSLKSLAATGIAYAWATADPQFQSLYRKVYFQIGGMQQIVDAFRSPKKSRDTKTGKRRGKPKHKVGFRTLVEVATVFDYHYRFLASDPQRFGMASVEKASSALTVTAKRPDREKSSTGFGRSHIQDLLKEHRHAIGLIYAAHLVSVGGMSLLELLTGKAPKLELVAGHIEEWLSYAVYFREEVLGNTKGKWDDTYCPEISGLAAQRPSLPPMTPKLIEQIEAAFSRKRLSEARLQ